MSKHFRPWNIDQTLLLPPNVRDFVPKDHVSRFIVGLVRESLDLKAIMCSYVSGLGQPPFDPRMMVSLLLHGYASGLYSSRRIARACSERNDFVMIVALDPPDFRTISDFRKRHLKALGELFLQVLKLCETPTITPEAKAWLVSLACDKAKEHGYPHELWTTRLLARHARERGPAAGHQCLARLAQGTVCKLLGQEEIKPHKVRYYLERRDAEFEPKMAEVLCVYREVQVLKKAAAKAEKSNKPVAIVSYDEKPGIQAIATTAPDLPPVPGRHASFARDHVHRIPQASDAAYPASTAIKLILDNHSAHISRETRAWLDTRPPGRFDFTFTPKHGSWLNLIEGFFSKFARSVLRHIRVTSKHELKQRIIAGIDDVNRHPVIHTWSYKLAEAA